ncbi:MAG: YtxH domain-containing protein [Bacteroidia bacterium]
MIAAFVAGALVGGALGILFAPDKGSTTRNRILTGAKDLTEDVRKKLKEEAEILRAKAAELEELAESKLEEITEAIKSEV